MLFSSLSLSSCLSSFIYLDFSRFFPCLSWSRPVSDSVVRRSDHFVALEHVACVSGGSEVSSSAILTMLLSVLFTASDGDPMIVHGVLFFMCVLIRGPGLKFNDLMCLTGGG